MGTITFVAPGFRRSVAQQPRSGIRRTLLSIAREHEIPILFTCEAGGCGACIVHLYSPGGSGRCALLTDEEALFLSALGKLTEGLEDDDRIGVGPRARLACQYVVGDEDLIVDFTNELGSV